MGLLSKLRLKRDPKALLVDAIGDAEVPNFPQAAMQTLKALRDPNTNSKAIARTIEVNPGLVIQVLKLVNSAAFGIRRRIDGVGQAVTLLGRGQVESLVVGVAVKRQLPTKRVAGFVSQRFWLAAFRRAALARALADLLHPQSRSEAFVAGLLQDMAVPLLATVRPRYGELLGHWHDDSDAVLHEIELAEFGWDHGAIGASLARRWDLPDRLALSIDGHHGGDEGVDAAVHLVSYIRESDAAPGVDQLVEVCRGRFNLAADDVTHAIESAFEEAEEVAKVFG